MKSIATPAAKMAMAGLLALGGSTGGCADDPQDEVYTYEAEDVDFSAFKTFAIVADGDYPDAPDLPDPPDPTVDLPDDVEQGLQTTNDAVVDQMTMLGMTQVDADADPDLYVLNYAASNDDSGVYWECIPGYYWWGWYGWWSPCQWVPVSVDYTVGSILVLVADPNAMGDPEEQVVFVGLAQGVLDGGNNDARIQQDVATMFTQWPTSD